MQTIIILRQTSSLCWLFTILILQQRNACDQYTGNNGNRSNDAASESRGTNNLNLLISKCAGNEILGVAKFTVDCVLFEVDKKRLLEQT